jgi:hypothetical protein
LTALLLTFALVLSACGSSADPDSQESETPSLSPAGVATPDPGPRVFPKPEGRFFDHDMIEVVNPDPSMRKRMELADNVYWLDDEAADSIIEHSLERLVFPLEGNRRLLGYEVGHILVHKFAVVRHLIEEISVEGNRIIFETRPAKMGEVVKHGNFYLHIRPGAEVPLGLDALDPYLYDSPEQLIEVVRANMDSRLIRNQVAGLNHEQLRMALPKGDEFVTRQQGLRCDYPEDPGGSEIYNCDDYIRNNTGEYRPQGSDHSECIVAGNWNYEAACVTDIEDNSEKYFPDAGAIPDPDPNGQGPQCGSQRCEYGQFCTSSQTCEWLEHRECIRNGFTKTDSNSDTVCICTGLSSAECIEQQCDKLCECDGLSLDECSHHVCKESCNLSSETIEQESGEAASGGFGGSLSFCLNTDTNPADTNRCPGTIPIEISKGYQLGPNILNLTLKPIFMATVGIKAGFDFDIDCCVDIEAVAEVGVYAGVGYGLNAALNIANAGVNGGDSLIKYWSDITGSPLARIPVWILELQLDPYLRMQFTAEAGLGGSIAYEYYNEAWFYACAWFGTSNGFEFKGGGETSGSTVTRCGLPNHSRDAEFNGFIEQGFNAEVGLGASLALGLELNLYGRHRTGVWFEPIRVLADLNASFRAPRCSWDYYIRFGALFGLGVDLGIISISHEWTWTWSFLPAFFGEGLFEGGIWESIFGCGLYDTADPYVGESLECSAGPEGDAQCTTDMGTEARCFVRECVEHRSVRASLGWFTPGADLDLYVRDPNGTQYSQATHFPGNITRHDCAGACSNESPSSRFIENAVFSQAIEGEYQLWVSLQPNSTTDQPVPYTIEVESNNTRQVFSGTIYPTEDDSTPTVFTLPVSN